MSKAKGIKLIERGVGQSNIAQDYGLSETAYSYGYNLRLKHASFMQDTLNWLSDNSSELLPVETPNILSLGCGSGIFDSTFIKIIQQQKKNWSFTGVDFSVTDLDHFRKKLSALDRKTQTNITLKYQKFTPSTDMGERYDFITMIHFLHSFDHVLPIIQNARRHLSTNGKLLIVQQKKRGISELKDKFLNLLPNQKFQCSDQIKTLLQSEKITFSTHTLKTSFDISIMQKMSLDTLVLMSFCLCNDLSILTALQQEKIREAFLLLSKERQDGSRNIEELMEVIVCQA